MKLISNWKIIKTCHIEAWRIQAIKLHCHFHFFGSLQLFIRFRAGHLNHISQMPKSDTWLIYQLCSGHALGFPKQRQNGINIYQLMI